LQPLLLSIIGTGWLFAAFNPAVKKAHNGAGPPELEDICGRTATGFACVVLLDFPANN